MKTLICDEAKLRLSPPDCKFASFVVPLNTAESLERRALQAEERCNELEASIAWALLQLETYLDVNHESLANSEVAVALRAASKSRAD